MSTPHYTAAELKEFKAIIQEKLAQANADLDELRAAMASGEGCLGINADELGGLAARQAKFIQHLESALTRIANKSYGICRITGQLIPKERLRQVPHATQCVEAKNADKEARG